MKLHHTAIAVCLACLCATSAWARPSYVTTTLPLASIMSEVVGDRGDVAALLPPGASVHTYQPRPSDAKLAGAADALFYVADQMDGWATALSPKRAVGLFAFLPKEMKMAAAANRHDEPDHDHDVEGGQDPHFWLDPLCVKAVLPELVRILGEIDPDGREAYAANAKRFGEALDVLDRELTAALEPCRGQAILLFHSSFQYFMKRYGIVVGGVIEPFPGKEPSPRYLQQLIALVREKSIRVVFSEPQLPARPAEVLAEAAGISVGTIDPLGGPAGRRTYAELLRFNAQALREALTK